MVPLVPPALSSPSGPKAAYNPTAVRAPAAKAITTQTALGIVRSDVIGARLLDSPTLAASRASSWV